MYFGTQLPVPVPIDEVCRWQIIFAEMDILEFELIIR